MQVTFEHVDILSDSVRTFYFRPDSAVHFTAGQFIELTIPHPDMDDRGDHRWFTLSSAPTDALLSITTKFADNHSSSYKQALQRLLPGTQLHMSSPMGDFVLPKFIQTPVVFVAAGIGVTPFHSMLRWLAATHEQRPIQLIHAVHSEDDIVFQDTFEQAGLDATIVVHTPSPAWGGERGPLSGELIVGLTQPGDDSLLFLSGPEPLIEKLERELLHCGVTKRQLVLDYFPNYTAV